MVRSGWSQLVFVCLVFVCGSVVVRCFVSFCFAFRSDPVLSGQFGFVCMV